MDTETNKMDEAEEMMFLIKLYDYRCPICKERPVNEYIDWHPTKFMTKVFTYTCYKCGFLVNQYITKTRDDRLIYRYSKGEF